MQTQQTLLEEATNSLAVTAVTAAAAEILLAPKRNAQTIKAKLLLWL